jgi:hypothetical protein
MLLDVCLVITALLIVPTVSLPFLWRKEGKKLTPCMWQQNHHFIHVSLPKMNSILPTVVSFWDTGCETQTLSNFQVFLLNVSNCSVYANCSPYCSLKDTDHNGQRRNVIERSWDTLGGVAMGWTDELGFWQGRENFLLSAASRLALGPTQPPM